MTYKDPERERIARDKYRARPEVRAQRAAYAKAWRVRNPDARMRYLPANRERYFASRAWLNDLKMARGCEHVLPDGSICGWREHPAALEWDHRDPALKAFTIGLSAGRSRVALAAEIAKCDVICSNHHRIRTVEEGHHLLRKDLDR